MGVELQPGVQIDNSGRQFKVRQNQRPILLRKLSLAEFQMNFLIGLAKPVLTSSVK